MGSTPSVPVGSQEASPSRRNTVSTSPPNRNSSVSSPHVANSPSAIHQPQVESIASAFRQQPLPQGWEVRTDKYGRPYFLDHIHRRTTFVDPRVPQGWEMQLDPQGRPYFIDHINKRTTWQDPRLLPGWEIQIDSQGRPYYIDHINKRTTYNDPKTLLDAQDLPPGWEMRLDPLGKPVYIDQVLKRTTYERPKKQPENNEEKKDAEAPAFSSEHQESSEMIPPSMEAHKELTPSDDDKSCIICLENERCVALIPCGHLCLCKPCSGSQKKCPVCRTPIKDFLRTFNV